ncbi:Hypothetical protein PP7435_CHR4-0418 [Komagataella phaffii CBS 7435]|nr:Hypothetical protein BQ9382_C4-2171 [Komagataella phaffii CBS 7435]CCA40585.1 Hypothetical protein PP7435_CHR4-0418 [Komagataella phaffii CBS 7435]
MEDRQNQINPAMTPFNRHIYTPTGIAYPCDNGNYGPLFVMTTGKTSNVPFQGSGSPNNVNGDNSASGPSYSHMIHHPIHVYPLNAGAAQEPFNFNSMGMGYVSSPYQQHPGFCSDSDLIKKKEFPESFNPKQTPNMPHKEKVNKWLVGLPYPTGNGENDDMDQDQINPRMNMIRYRELPTSYSGTFSDNEPSSLDDCISLSDYRDLLELQARKLSYYVCKLYHNQPEPESHDLQQQEDELKMRVNVSYELSSLMS